ncbi:vacuolar-processing enzyme isoform X1 [Triticum aestivum]|uniref:Legumain prodomain domain-containing protein n=2 Tax=Triticum aestivum TaxID=4565 RepID=A0A3B6QJQ6_WHEAT|nr:vacuolar-processing enzyme-like isoform X1 [Triticum aestivum]XP_044421392.1 vacuolar-processing enzyme-like isoform X1 [Triticum aestivum]XP_044421393.1 vacuolar-processing enzyme-like isoform X1 [Triticum aestivum]XP_044421394.1 vacuolar-processing enzyme-like isoform X1 [Triticum aestivum]XP_044421395.1 vacuolar-processing enzyme-like isoform X1 [Triticum aestivum]XP_044421396.1 vacuolar-processing enzyme-like isoform X1 [Triticum aestivum]XP_044421397.1 vacuolar-processing enzyme-like 
MGRLHCFPLLQLLIMQSQMIGLSASGFPVPPLEQDDGGTRWAVLIAGSNGYDNYRHQANVCHAYQILKTGGLKEENIVVFMYDDIAGNPENPRPGVIINHPKGGDVYAGVPKDYTGDDVNVNNFVAALLGDRSRLTGTGSGKVILSGPNDHVFVYYADHGGPGILGMPNGEFLYAKQLVQTLEKKYSGGAGYKSLVIYVESCEAGTIFDGLLPRDIAVYATTASNSTEFSYAAYCPDDDEPSEFHTCLGDLYSVAWMEDSEAHNMRVESLKEQLERVRNRTGTHSHVMEYGDLDISAQKVHAFMGTNPANDNITVADLRVQPSAERELPRDTMARRAEEDRRFDLISSFLLGSEKGHALTAGRLAGQPLVDDWRCLETMVSSYEDHCGPLSTYGRKYLRVLASVCNAGIPEEVMAKAASQLCWTVFSAQARANN